MIVKFDKQTYIAQAIQNSLPQSHRSKWTNEEDDILLECIGNGLSLADIAKIIRLRSFGAIRTRANHLGYGNKKNKKDDDTYFFNKINHKTRRGKDEMLKELEKVPIEPKNPMGEDIEIASDIIPKKVEIFVDDIDVIIQILTAAKAVTVGKVEPMQMQVGVDQ